MRPNFVFSWCFSIVGRNTATLQWVDSYRLERGCQIFERGASLESSANKLCFLHHWHFWFIGNLWVRTRCQNCALVNAQLSVTINENTNGTRLLETNPGAHKRSLVKWNRGLFLRGGNREARLLRSNQIASLGERLQGRIRQSSP